MARFMLSTTSHISFHPLPSAALYPLGPNRRTEREPGVPGKEDPGVLRHLGDERVDHRAAHRLGIDGREVRLRQQIAHYLGGLAGVDEVVDDQHALAVAAADARDLVRDALDQLEVALGLVAVALHAHGLDHPDAE